MSFYEKLSATADRLIEKYGQKIEIETKADFDPDPVDGSGGLNEGTRFTVYGVLASYPDRLIDGTRIKKGDRELMVGAVGDYEPQITDRPIINSKEWAIVGIDTVNPGGTGLIYKLQVRG